MASKIKGILFLIIVILILVIPPYFFGLGALKDYWFIIAFFGIIGFGIIFSFLTRPFRRGSYGRLVAWIERKYGKIDKNWDSGMLSSYMSDVLSRESAAVSGRKIEGLRHYVQSGKYIGLLKNNP